MLVLERRLQFNEWHINSHEKWNEVYDVRCNEKTNSLIEKS